jgi:predicted enzyme related to lactoylglutathione lyase
MSDMHGKFVWIELMTSDPKAAEGFYSKVVGWSAKDSGQPGMSYTLLSMGETMMGGLMAIPEEAKRMGAGPIWLGYIAVDDVDAYAAKITAAGGRILKEPTDIPGMLRFAVVADPYMTAFMIMKGFGDPPEGGMPAPGTPGSVGWRELHAGALDGAWAFYSSLFGWTKGDAMDMGPDGKYQLFSIDGVQSGGMMTKMAKSPAPFWLYYFNVPKLDSCVEAITANGGQIANGPMQVPGGQWIVQAIDPQGAMFALVANER